MQQLGTAGLLLADEIAEQSEQHHQQGGVEEEEEPTSNEGGFYFCDQPHGEYAHVIFTSNQRSSDGGSHSNRSLWNVESIHSMCQLDQVLRSSEHFPSICQQPANSHQCCPSWTLGHYVALMRNRTSCTDIDESDVTATLKILEVCSKHYHGLRLSPNCDTIVQEGEICYFISFPTHFLF